MTESKVLSILRQRLTDESNQAITDKSHLDRQQSELDAAIAKYNRRGVLIAELTKAISILEQAEETR